MPPRKSDRVAELLAELDRIETGGGDPAGQALLVARDLGDKSAVVVARAADLATDAHVAELTAAFERMLQGEDGGCRAKTALVRALDRVEARADEVYLRAIRHVQLEWSGPRVQEDVADGMRGIAAIALVNVRSPEAPLELARLLADASPRARASAAHAMAAWGRHEMVPLLWFKALTGDRDPDVTTEVLSALLWIEGASVVDRVAALLGGDDHDRGVAAAMALGQARLPEALAPLVAWTESTGLSTGARKAGFLAIAMLRLPAAVGHLLGLVREAPVLVARPALEALLLHKHDAAHLAAVEARNMEGLTAILAGTTAEPALSPGRRHRGRAAGTEAEPPALRPGRRR